MKVKIIKHCSVPFEGHDYTPADGVFDLPDGIAQVLIDGGTCGEPDLSDDNEDITDDEEPELLSLPSVGSLLNVLEEAGYTTVDDIIEADIDDLVALHGIGEKTAEALKNEASAFVEEE